MTTKRPELRLQFLYAVQKAESQYLATTELFSTHDGRVACKTHKYGDWRWRRMADHERTDWTPSDKWLEAQPFQPFGDYEAQIQECPLEEREIVVYRCEECGEG